MTLRFQSTGKAVFSEEDDGARGLREARRAQNPASARLKALEEIRRHRESQEKSPTERHAEAIKTFGYRNPDFEKDSRLVMRLADEYQEMTARAISNGEVIQDWNKALDDAADRVREKFGHKSRGEQERTENLEKMRRARGKD